MYTRLHLLDLYEVVGNSLLWGLELLNLIEEAGSSDVIVGIHQERSTEAIKYLIYCLFCRCYFSLNENNELVFDESLTVDESFALNTEDIGKPVIPELLLQRQPSNISTAYCDMVQRGVSELMNEASNVTRNDNDYTDEQCQAMSFAELFRAYEAGSPRAALWFGRQKEAQREYPYAYRAYEVYEASLEKNAARNYTELREFNLVMLDFLKRWEEDTRYYNAHLYIKRYEKELYVFDNWQVMCDLLKTYKEAKVESYPKPFLEYLAKMEKGEPERKVVAADIYRELSSLYRATACYQEIAEDATVNTITRAKALLGLWNIPNVTPNYDRIDPAVFAVAAALSNEKCGDYALAEKKYHEALSLDPSLRDAISPKLASPEFKSAVKDSRRKNKRTNVTDAFAIAFGLFISVGGIIALGKLILSFIKFLLG